MTVSPLIIFGGTFDPIHEGHISAIRYALNLFPSCRIAPTTKNPWKSEQPTSVELRIQMIELVLAAERLPLKSTHENLGVSIDATPYEFAYELVSSLRVRFPHRDILWLVGADSAASVPRWKDWDQLQIGLLVAPITIDVHASELRAGTRNYHPAIRQFIRDAGLYKL